MARRLKKIANEAAESPLVNTANGPSPLVDVAIKGVADDRH